MQGFYHIYFNAVFSLEASWWHMVTYKIHIKQGAEIT